MQRLLGMEDGAEVDGLLRGSAAHEAVHRLDGDKLEVAPRDHVVRVLEAAAGLY